MPPIRPRLPEPYWKSHDGHHILYHGDCLKILPLLGKVDLVLTDPPYGVAYVTARRSRYDDLRSKIKNDETLDTLLTAWPLIRSKMKDDSHYYVFCSPRRISEAEVILGKPKHLLCWDKGDRGTVGDLECGFGEAWEGIFYGMVGGRKPLNGKRPRTVVREDWSSTMDPVHPTVKPIALLTKLIEWSSIADDLVFDPFTGSGTTGVAAIRLKRRFIGIEIEEKYCKIAARRLQEEWERMERLRIAEQNYHNRNSLFD